MNDFAAIVRRSQLNSGGFIGVGGNNFADRNNRPENYVDLTAGKSRRAGAAVNLHEFDIFAKTLAEFG